MTTVRQRLREQEDVVITKAKERLEEDARMKRMHKIQAEVVPIDAPSVTGTVYMVWIYKNKPFGEVGPLNSRKEAQEFIGDHFRRSS